MLNSWTSLAITCFSAGWQERIHALQGISHHTSMLWNCWLVPPWWVNHDTQSMINWETQEWGSLRTHAGDCSNSSLGLASCWGHFFHEVFNSKLILVACDLILWIHRDAIESAYIPNHGIHEVCGWWAHLSLQFGKVPLHLMLCFCLVLLISFKPHM